MNLPGSSAKPMRLGVGNLNKKSLKRKKKRRKRKRRGIKKIQTVLMVTVTHNPIHKTAGGRYDY